MAMRFLLAGSLLVALVAARVPEEQTPLEASVSGATSGPGALGGTDAVARRGCPQAHEVVPLLSEAKNVVKESQLKGSEYSAKISNVRAAAGRGVRGRG